MADGGAACLKGVCLQLLLADQLEQREVTSLATALQGCIIDVNDSLVPDVLVARSVRHPAYQVG